MTEATMAPVAEYHDRSAWEAKRRGHITATDAAAILGVSPYKSAAQVQQEKLYGRDELEDKPILRRGRSLEDVVAQEWELRTGRRQRRVPFRVSRQEPLIACSADRVALADDEHPTRPLELKTAGWHVFDQIRRGGLTDMYNVQGQIQSFVHEKDATEWAILHPDSFKLLPFTVEAEPDFQAAMVETLTGWWDRHIINREPVDPTEAPSIELPEVSGEIRMVGGDTAQVLEDLADAKEVRDSAQAFYDELKERIKAEFDLAVYETESGIRVYHAERGGGKGRFSATKGEVAQLIDPARLQVALVDALVDRARIPQAEVLELLSEIADEVRVDLDEFVKPSKAYREVRVYRVSPVDQAF